ncbi:hypothetical protein ACJIZ3_013981 [Penstemon smallii]|uniref:Ribosomal protein L34 n=1 Tax=Penstemon smallii TaxID=265156 RepID=A0ABD3RIK9_9LAMI
MAKLEYFRDKGTTRKQQNFDGKKSVEIIPKISTEISSFRRKLIYFDGTIYFAKKKKINKDFDRIELLFLIILNIFPCCQIPHLRPTEYKRSRLSRNRRTVNRPYGGVLSGGAVRERIIRAFLVEEQKIVKKVVKIQKAKEKLAAKSK